MKPLPVLLAHKVLVILRKLNSTLLIIIFHFVHFLMSQALA